AMAQAALQSLLRHVRTAAQIQAARDLSDRELLQRFTALREEAAFTLLVPRHGPMVLSLCRRLLGPADAADGAFPATFLVLVPAPDPGARPPGRRPPRGRRAGQPAVRRRAPRRPARPRAGRLPARSRKAGGCHAPRGRLARGGVGRGPPGARRGDRRPAREGP